MKPSESQSASSVTTGPKTGFGLSSAGALQRMPASRAMPSTRKPRFCLRTYAEDISIK